jgi:hemerythrin-like domain-containing protein
MDQNHLARHHAELDQRAEVLLTAADGGDCHDLAIAWGHFESEVLRHFEIEENELFERYLPEHPYEIARLTQEHETLRRDVLALGISADLHSLRADAVRAFISELRAHGVLEEQTLYSWAGDVEGATWAKIARGLRETRDAVTKRLADELSELGARTL